MSSKYKVVLFCVVYFSCEVVMTGGEVVLVKRNVTDSFRVGEDGCTNDSSCPSSSACQRDSGLCLCGHKRAFLNSECLRNRDIRLGVGGVGVACVFKPFQLIPYSHNAAATQFRQENSMTRCSLNSRKKPQIKFPNITNVTDLQWLDDSYVTFSVSNNILDFKWAKSVPGLRGTIITLYFRCSQGGSTVPNCLRAKVLGTWPSDQNPPEPTPVTNPETTSVPSTKPPSAGITKPNSPTIKSATSDVRSSATSTTSPTSSTSTTSATSSTNTTPTSSVNSSSPGKVSDSDDDSSGTIIIIIAAVVPVVMLIVLVGVIWWLCRRRKENRHSNSRRGSSAKRNGASDMKELTNTKRNAHEENAYEDVAESFAAHSNSGYATPDSQRVIVEANPTYDSTPVFSRRDAVQAISHEEPGYEDPYDVKKKDLEATAEKKKADVDSHQYSTISTPDDIERVEINGDMYALPDKSETAKKRLDYQDLSTLASNSQDVNESHAQSGEPVVYADIADVMK